MRKIQIAIMALGLAGAMNAKAVIVYATDAYGKDFYEGGGGTVGSVFTVSSSVTVFQAGLLDFSGGGLAGSHAIGVWDSSGNLLDTATVDAGTVDPLRNGFRWVTLAHSLTLTPGNNYVVGADYSGVGINDHFRDNATINPPFTWIQTVDSNPDGTTPYPGGLVFTTLTDGPGSTGNFGPNLAVPEPTTMVAGALLLLPFGASTLRMLRKHRTA